MTLCMRYQALCPARTYWVAFTVPDLVKKWLVAAIGLRADGTFGADAVPAYLPLVGMPLITRMAECSNALLCASGSACFAQASGSAGSRPLQGLKVSVIATYACRCPSPRVGKGLSPCRR